MSTKTETENSSFDFPSLHTAVRKTLLPTLVAADGQRGPDYAKANRPGSGGDDLMTHMCRQLLPTPTTRDWKDTPGMALETEDGRSRNDQLPRRIFEIASATSATNSLGGMRLTPEFQCWLMGFPPDWLKPLRDALATPSCPKSPKSSPAPSSPPNSGKPPESP